MYTTLEVLTPIMDNAAFHKKKEIREIANKHGHNVLFLPPYSPDFIVVPINFRMIIRNIFSFEFIKKLLQCGFISVIF